MEQTTLYKLNLGAIFFSVVMIIYWGNHSSNLLLEKIELNDQKLEQVITEMEALKSKIKQRVIIVENNKLEEIKDPRAKAVEVVKTLVEQNSTETKSSQENIETLVDVNVVEVERVECCEGDDWAEIQEVRIREVINTEIAVDTDLTINSIECEDVICMIDITIHDKSGMPLVAKTMSKLSPKDDDKNFIDLKNLQITNAGIQAKIRLLKKELADK